ncbi:unnamed protein product [Ixodes hexagonus]
MNVRKVLMSLAHSEVSFKAHARVLPTKSVQCLAPSAKLCRRSCHHEADNNRPSTEEPKPHRAKVTGVSIEQRSDADKQEAEDPFARFPENTNPCTGEIGGPTGPEPTRFGDWERKGRVTDF